MRIKDEVHAAAPNDLKEALILTAEDAMLAPDVRTAAEGALAYIAALERQIAGTVEFPGLDGSSAPDGIYELVHAQWFKDEPRDARAFAEECVRVDRLRRSIELSGIAASVVIEEIERLRPHYADSVTSTGVARNQLLDHFEKMARSPVFTAKAVEKAAASPVLSQDFSESSFQAASAILTRLGFGQEPSADPGIDPRRDAIARIVEAHVFSSPVGPGEEPRTTGPSEEQS